MFDDKVIIVDEAHNLISRIVNKIKKEKVIPENKKGEKEHLPLNLSTKLYELLMSARNSRIVLLTGTPVINYPNEFGILFNILRGYIKTWKITINVQESKQKNKSHSKKYCQQNPTGGRHRPTKKNHKNKRKSTKKNCKN